jgi:hypothetical protein
VPLKILKLRPGIDRSSTTLAVEGTWFDCDKIRFRSGQPSKLGGWVRDGGVASATLQPPEGAFWGVARAMWAWRTLAGANLLAVGTHLKYYIQDSAGGLVHDITPIRKTSAIASGAFTTTSGSGVVRVNDPGYGGQTGDFVTISGVAGAVNGVPQAQLNAEHQITALDSSTYTITVPTAATSSGTSGAATAVYQIGTGGEGYTTNNGWGSGGWGGISGTELTGWGVAATAGVGAKLQLRLWSQGNFGEFLLFNPRGGGLYLWTPNANPTVYDRGVRLSPTSSGIYQTDADCPSVANWVDVADGQRFAVAFGCNDYGSTVQDPLLIRWSDQEDYATWSPAITNQAGSYRLSRGSEIVTALQTRQEFAVWTDAALYSMQYIGAPYVWGVQLLADNVSIMSPRAAATAGGTTFWMGVDKFYAYTGRVETLQCPVWSYLFDDIDRDQAYQVFAGTNEGFNEVWWFYCSRGSTTVDKYVIFNYSENTWVYGTMARTAWLDTPLRQSPVACGYGGQLIDHEVGTDDGTTNPASPIVSYAQSADINIEDGHRYGFVWRIVPDVTFDGSTAGVPAVNLTVRPRRNPGADYGPSAEPDVVSADNYNSEQTYTVQRFTEMVYVRVRGRQMAFRIGSDSLGTHWEMGATAIDVRPSGRR